MWAGFRGGYLAGSIIVLMLSGGEALESGALRSASSVLRALTKRIPSVAQGAAPRVEGHSFIQHLGPKHQYWNDFRSEWPFEPDHRRDQPGSH